MSNNRKQINMQDVASKPTVIQFPKTMDEQHLQNAQEAIDYVKQVRQEFSDEITELTTEQLFSWLSQYGAFTNPSRINAKDMLMIEHAIQSALYRYFNLEHPLQDISEQVFEITDSEETNSESE